MTHDKPKHLFGSLKSIAFVLVLMALLLASGLIVTKNPPFIRKPPQSSGNPDVRVWVNTNSGVYHCPNERWYGNTKHGMFMTQREAQAKGYRPAYGVVCG